MTIKDVVSVFAGSDLVVIGYNPEAADYDNPRGEIVGHAPYVVANAPDGSRWLYVGKAWSSRRWETDAMEGPRAFAARVIEALAAGRKLDGRFWEPTRPCYGSEAYATGCWSAVDAAEERLTV